MNFTHVNREKKKVLLLSWGDRQMLMGVRRQACSVNKEKSMRIQNRCDDPSDVRISSNRTEKKTSTLLGKSQKPIQTPRGRV